MYAKTLIGALAVMALAGCSSTAEERRLADENACRGYGFAVGSDAFANCLLQLDLDRRESRRQQLNSAPPLFPGVVVIERPAPAAPPPP